MRTTGGRVRGGCREGADAIECDVQATRDRVNRRPARSRRSPIDSSRNVPPRRSRARARHLVLLPDLLAWARTDEHRIAGRDQGPRMRPKPCADDRRERVARTDRGSAVFTDRRSPPERRTRPRSTSLMIGSVPRPGRSDPARAAFRVDGVHHAGKRGRRGRIVCSTRRAIERLRDAGAGRSRSGTRNARANCAHWSRSSPMPSAPTCRRCCGGSWIRARIHAATANSCRNARCRRE